MNDSGWRKRQIALDKMAENARELGLDYEPDKIIVDMIAKVYGVVWASKRNLEDLKAFAALVRADAIADEREACAKVCDRMAQHTQDIRSAALESAAENIRARGQA